MGQSTHSALSLHTQPSITTQEVLLPHTGSTQGIVSVLLVLLGRHTAKYYYTGSITASHWEYSGCCLSITSITRAAHSQVLLHRKYYCLTLGVLRVLSQYY